MSKCMLLEVVGDFEHLSLYISLSGLNLNWSLLMRKLSRKVAAHFSAAWSRSHKRRSDLTGTKDLEVQVIIDDIGNDWTCVLCCYL